MEELLDLVEYSELSKSGLVWKTTRNSKAIKGKPLGSLDRDKYYQFKVNGRGYKAHRVVWFLHYGEIPAGLEIDHIDRNRSNNKIGNLRCVTHQRNCLNTASNRKHPGVAPSGRGFKQEIRIKGKVTYLGTFDTEEKAYQAYCLKLEELENLVQDTVEINKLAKKWTPESTNTLYTAVEGLEVVGKQLVNDLAEKLETSARSVASKLRKSGYTVESLSTPKTAWTDAQTAELHEVLEGNPQEFTYAELAEQLSFEVGARTVQGKVLSEELTHLVKATPKKEVVRSYSVDEEDQFVQMANDGVSIDAIAAHLNRTLPQVRGKALSLHREGRIEAIPKQEATSRKVAADAFHGLDLSAMSVADLVEATGKGERSVKSMLTRRGVSCQDYDGAAKKAAADEKKAKVAAE